MIDDDRRDGDDGGGGGTGGGAARRAPSFERAAPPPLELPKASGSLRGLGEKFQAGGPTGTGSLSIPLAISPCRGGAEPKLALKYDSAQGQGPFGMGWRLSVPSIVRRTDKGIPRYADAQDSDVFILSDQEDLVPVSAAVDGGGQAVSLTDGPYRVDAFRPRVEGLFARIERRTHLVTGDTHWRSITAGNVTSVFGLSSSARITDPSNPRHVFRWLLEATFDTGGHATFYEYKAEDLDQVAVDDVAEASRRVVPPANRYLKRVHYGNCAPLGTAQPRLCRHRRANLAVRGRFRLWRAYGRSARRGGALGPAAGSILELQGGVRDPRLPAVPRILMFHEIEEELGAQARLVRATVLGYDPHPAVTYLTSVTGVGYAWDAAGAVTTANTPTLTFDFTRVGALSTRVIAVDERSLFQAPAGIDGRRYQLVDLDGEGIPGILMAAAPPAPTLVYKRNLGEGRFATGQTLPAQPSLETVSDQVRLISLNGDGRLDAARLAGPTPGFFERTPKYTWGPFATFGSMPNVDLSVRGCI